MFHYKNNFNLFCCENLSLHSWAEKTSWFLFRCCEKKISLELSWEHIMTSFPWTKVRRTWRSLWLPLTNRLEGGGANQATSLAVSSFGDGEADYRATSSASLSEEEELLRSGDDMVHPQKGAGITPSGKDPKGVVKGHSDKNLEGKWKVDDLDHYQWALTIREKYDSLNIREFARCFLKRESKGRGHYGITKQSGELWSSRECHIRRTRATKAFSPTKSVCVHLWILNRL